MATKRRRTPRRGAKLSPRFRRRLRDAWRAISHVAGNGARHVLPYQEATGADGGRDPLALGLLLVAVVIAPGVWHLATGPLAAGGLLARDLVGMLGIVLPILLILTAIDMWRPGNGYPTRRRLAGLATAAAAIAGLLDLATRLRHPHAALANAGGAIGDLTGGAVGRAIGPWPVVLALIVVTVVAAAVNADALTRYLAARETAGSAAAGLRSRVVGAKPDFPGENETAPGLAPVSPRSSAGAKPRPSAVEALVGAATAPLPKGDRLRDGYRLPPFSLLAAGQPVRTSTKESTATAATLQRVLNDFKVGAQVVAYMRGPGVTRYEISLQRGVKVDAVLKLGKDVGLALSQSGVRIYSPVEGKSRVGIEVPNSEPSIVRLSDVLAASCTDPHPLTAGIGLNIDGRTVLLPLGELPHVLVAGATGAGKSALLNAFIVSLLMKSTPSEMRLLLIDPKRVEFGAYQGLPHLAGPIATNAFAAVDALTTAVDEMDSRYKDMAATRTRNITAYNQLRMEAGEEPLPYWVVVVDELADLMATSKDEVEGAIIRIAQLARAAGIHLVVATQRPTVDVITGLIKANVPARLAFATASPLDSRVILDQGGAETLRGKGDGLYLPIGARTPDRFQGAWVSDAEIDAVVAHWRGQAGNSPTNPAPQAGPVANPLPPTGPGLADVVPLVSRRQRHG